MTLRLLEEPKLRLLAEKKTYDYNKPVDWRNAFVLKKEAMKPPAKIMQPSPIGKAFKTYLQEAQPAFKYGVTGRLEAQQKPWEKLIKEEYPETFFGRIDEPVKKEKYFKLPWAKEAIPLKGTLREYPYGALGEFMDAFTRPSTYLAWYGAQKAIPLVLKKALDKLPPNVRAYLTKEIGRPKPTQNLDKLSNIEIHKELGIVARHPKNVRLNRAQLAKQYLSQQKAGDYIRWTQRNPAELGQALIPGEAEGIAKPKDIGLALTQLAKQFNLPQSKIQAIKQGVYTGLPAQVVKAIQELTPSKGGDLIEEAKKYKSVEEFIKVGEKVNLDKIAERLGVPMGLKNQPIQEQQIIAQKVSKFIKPLIDNGALIVEEPRGSFARIYSWNPKLSKSQLTDIWNKAQGKGGEIYEYHLSNNPNLETVQLKGDKEGLIYTTKTPHLWQTQLNYERGIGKENKYIYLVEVKNPSKEAGVYGHETASPTDEVKIIKQLGTVNDFSEKDRPISIGELERKKESILKSLKAPTPSKGGEIYYTGGKEVITDFTKKKLLKTGEEKLGTHFTTSEDYAKTFAGKEGKLTKVTLDIKKPYEITEANELLIEAPYSHTEFIKGLKDKGYDAIVLKGQKRAFGQGTHNQVFVLDPSIIKPTPSKGGEIEPLTPQAEMPLRLLQEKEIPLVEKAVAPPIKPPVDLVAKGAEGPEGEGIDVAKAYEKQKDVWIGQKDVRVLQSNIEKSTLQTEIKTALGKKKYDIETQDVDKAIQLYIDTKRNPQNLKDYYKDLTSEQKRIVNLSQNLPPQAQAIANKISESYKAIGLEAQEADIIKNTLDNYAGRIWDLSPEQKTQVFRKFGTTTGHAKQRTFDTILEGWSKGYKLKVEGATNNLQILKEEMIKTIEDKNFLKALRKLKTIDGEPLLTTKQIEGYIRVEHPNFKMWKYAGEAVPDKVYGKNMFVDKDGNLFERQELYAPEVQAKNLNNILGISKLKGLPGVDAITKFNANVKALILQSSFFHHLAFMRSYYLGTNHKVWSEMSIRQAYRQGLEAIKQENPVIMLGVKNGLTLGLKQDWNEELLREEDRISKFLDKNKVSKVVKDKVMKLRQDQAEFLFGKLGAGLKAKAFLIEYRNMSKKHPGSSSDQIAKMVANLINDDFGGLHLQRLGRNPTLQHVFRLFALAPDWTESNIRSMVKAFGAGGKQETEFYRRFWAGILTKGVLLTVLGNALMAGLDEDDSEATGAGERFIRNYKRAWKEGKLRWLDIDITPIYKGLGGDTSNRKYFSIFGHFKDPLKFATHPIRSAHHKGSVVYKFFHEALVGADWAGRKFTTFPELFGMDDTGKKKGKTVSWDFKGRGPLEYKQIPSFMISQVKGWMPIQIQNLLNWIAGEMEGFDAIAQSMGLGTGTTHEKEPTVTKGFQRQPFQRQEFKRQPYQRQELRLLR